MSNEPPTRRPSADPGFALIATMLSVVIVSAVVLVLISSALGELRGTADHRDREASVHAAESAVDVAVERVQANPSYTTGHAWPFTSPPTPAAERAWARDQLAAATAAASPPPSLLSLPAVACTVGSTTCTPMPALMIRPSAGGTPMDVVYGVAAAPGAPASQARVIRADILRGGYRPEHAVLTGWDMLLDAELIVLGTHGSVHVNGYLDVRKTTSASGDVTATGAFAGQERVTVPPDRIKAANQPAVPLPSFTAATYYDRRFEVPFADWYDLCPDGRAHERSAGAPCSGPIRTTPASFRTGSGRWELNGTAPPDGVFYVHERDFVITGNPGLNAAVRPRLTVIVAKQPVDCGAGGNIDVDSDGWINPYLADGTLLIGDREVRVRRKSRLGDASAPAFIAAGGAIRTDNEPVVHGALVGRNTCAGERNDLKGKPQVTYDGNLTIQIGGGALSIGAWNEL